MQKGRAHEAEIDCGQKGSASSRGLGKDRRNVTLHGQIQKCPQWRGCRRKKDQKKYDRAKASGGIILEVEYPTGSSFGMPNVLGVGKKI